MTMMMKENYHKRALVIVGEQKMPGFYRNRPDEYDIYVFAQDDDYLWEAAQLKDFYRQVLIMESGNVREVR